MVENERALAKAGDDPKKRRKVIRKKPPEGFVSWGTPTFERLVAAEPEPLTSSFKVSHAMLLNVIARPGNAFAAMRHLLTDNHEDRGAQRAHIGRAIEIYRAMLAGGVVERLAEPDAGTPGAAHRGPAVRLRPQPAAVAVRAGRDRVLDRPPPGYPLDALWLSSRPSTTRARYCPRRGSRPAARRSRK